MAGGGILMPGIENIKEKILEDANKNAEEVRKKAQSEAISINKESMKKAEKKKEEIISSAKKDAEIVKQRLISNAQLEGKKEKYNSKQDLVNEAFDKALIELCDLPNKKYEKTLIDVILQIAETGKEEILLNVKDRKRVSGKFIEDLNKALKSKGLEGNTVLSKKTAEIKGGAVLKSGDIEINGSFESLLRMKKEFIEPEVHNILFQKVSENVKLKSKAV